MTDRSRTKTGSSVALGFVLLLAAAAAVVGLAWLAWDAFTSLPTGVASATAVAVTTAGASIASLILSRQWERRRDIEQEHRRQKIPVYEDFMEFWLRMLLATRTGEAQATEVEIARFGAAFAQKIIIWGSDAVLKDYARFRTAGGDGAAGIVAFENLLYAIRADIGHKNKGLVKGDLLSLFINDVSKLVDMPGAGAVPAGFARSPS